jgi:hypothetical protein
LPEPFGPIIPKISPRHDLERDPVDGRDLAVALVQLLDRHHDLPPTGRRRQPGQPVDAVEHTSGAHTRSPVAELPSPDWPSLAHARPSKPRRADAETADSLDPDSTPLTSPVMVLALLGDAGQYEHCGRLRLGVL